MYSPLWIINSVFAAAAALTASYVVLAPTHIPKRVSLVVSAPAAPIGSDVSKINPARIYQGNDLWGTYIAPVAPPTPAEGGPVKPTVAPLPQPPRLQQARIPSPEQPQFLAPLALAIKGVMYSSLRNNNRAIIEETKSKREGLYRVGDILEDAEIIYIGRNKVVFLRPNGQEETIYISETAAQEDTLYPQPVAWNTIITQTSTAAYTINVPEFIQRVRSLAQVLDELGIVTAFRDNRPLGCKIGNLGSASWGRLLGLQQGDIVTALDDVALSSTSERVQAYQMLRSLTQTRTITVSVIRGGNPLYLEYTLELPSPSTSGVDTAASPEPSSDHLLRSPQDLQRQREIFDASAQSASLRSGLKKRDTQAMLERGGRKSVVRRRAS